MSGRGEFGVHPFKLLHEISPEVMSEQEGAVVIEEKLIPRAGERLCFDGFENLWVVAVADSRKGCRDVDADDFRHAEISMIRRATGKEAVNVMVRSRESGQFAALDGVRGHDRLAAIAEVCGETDLPGLCAEAERNRSSKISVKALMAF